MKYSYALICLLILSITASAGTTSVNEKTRTLNEVARLNKLAKTTSNKTNIVAFRQTGNRHDTYNSAAISWTSADSNLLQYNSDGNDTLDFSYGYVPSSSTWLNNVKSIKTWDNGHVSNYLYQRWVPTTASWRNATQYVFSYVASGAYDNYYTQIWDTIGNVWVNSYKNIYTYDANFHELTQSNQSWDAMGNVWLNGEKTIKTYDANGNMTNRTYQEWSTVINAWVKQYNYVFTFDANNNKTQELDQSWDGMGWQNTSQHLYTYTGHNMLTQLDQMWVPSSSSWLNSSKDTYGYQNNFATERITQAWDTTLVSWVNYRKYEYTNNAAGLITMETDSNWDAMSIAFIPTYKYAATYNGNNHITQSTNFYWNSPSSSYIPQNQTITAYDIYENDIHEFHEDYVPSASNFEFTDQYFFYYQAFTVSGIEESATITELNAYPNPVVGSNLNVAFSLETASDISINMYDINGRLITTETSNYPAGSNIAQLNIGNLPNGIYHLQYVNLKDKTTASLKLIVQ